MIVKDEIIDMEITAFDKQAKSMTNINISLMNTTTKISKTKILDRINNIINKKFTLTIDLSQQSIRDDLLNYRIYRSIPIISHGETSTQATT